MKPLLRMQNLTPLLLLLVLLMLHGCGMHPIEDVTPPIEQDGPPLEKRDFQAIADPVPRVEALSRYGNHTPYQVFGKTYHVLDTAADYDEEGMASWYGRKFAGRPTSSMEPYDPYALTAAHRSLPLPSYARVTNLENGREIIVRINDRGPFHSDRIIDLSYAAAGKLGFVDAGTAPVRVTVIAHPHAEPEVPVLANTPEPTARPTPVAATALSIPTPPITPPVSTPPTSAPNVKLSTPPPSAKPLSAETPKPAAPPTQKPSLTRGYFLQAGAFRVQASAHALKATLAESSKHPVSILTTGTPALYRVRIGPFPDEQSARAYQQKLERGDDQHAPRNTVLIRP